MSARILSAGIVPVRCESGSWLFLLLRAYSYWDFPKGLVEKNEDPWDAALRELREETGIARAHPRWGMEFYETAPYQRNKVARYYLAEVFDEKVSLRPNPELGMPEHHEFRWLRHDQAKALLQPRVREVLQWAGSRIAQSSCD